MDPDRKRQILKAEERFTLRERLSRALAEKGVYVFGRLTHDARAVPEPERDPDTAARTPVAPSPASTGTLHVVAGADPDPTVKTQPSGSADA